MKKQNVLTNKDRLLLIIQSDGCKIRDHIANQGFKVQF